MYFLADTGPTGADVMTRITETTGGHFRVDYTAKVAGK